MAVSKKRVTKKADDIEQGPKNDPVAADGLVFVNGTKYKRAVAIVDLLTGKTLPKTQGDAELKERFSAHLADAEVSTKSEEAIRFVYEKLGGLVRTPDEQAEADAEAATMRAQNKRRRIEADK